MLQAQQDFTWVTAPQQLALAAELQGLFNSVSRPGHLSFRIALDEIKFNEKTFEFRQPIELKITQDCDVWSCEACGIVSLGESPMEAAVSFSEDFAVLWDEIAQQPDETLTQGAQKTKECMLSVVKSVC